MQTVKATLAAIRALGLSATHTDGEYRVAPRVDVCAGATLAARRDRQENAAYYTNDGEDAVGTAKAMLASLNA